MTTNIGLEQVQPNSRPMPPRREAGSGQAGPEDRSVLRLGAIAGVLGLVLQIVMEASHPARANADIAKTGTTRPRSSRLVGW